MQKVNLNLIPGSVRPVVNVSQYDEGRQFQLAVFNGPTAYDLTGKTVTIEVGKLDGNGCAYGVSDTVNGVPVVAVSGNVVTITTPIQMTAVAGDNMAELKVADSNAEIRSLNFILCVEQGALDPGTPISDTQIPALIDEAEANAQRAEDAVAHYPYIDSTTKNWMVWDAETGQFVDTGVRAEGIDGTGSVSSVNSVMPDVLGNVTLALATDFSDVLPVANGGTGNADGYIRTGQQTGYTAGAAATAEGTQVKASGNLSHAEGSYTTASGEASHAEGGNTTASGDGAHAEGGSTTASGHWSHAGGLGTVAGYIQQTAIGSYNDNKSDSILEVGNGTANNARSNAVAVKTDGRITKGSSDAFPAASNLAAVEMTRTMSAQRIAGSFVYVVADDQLYKITTTITAPGGTLTPGTNATAVPVGDVLTQLSSDVETLKLGTLAGGYVDISGYSSSNKYTTPTDGYVWVSAPFNGVGTVSIQSAGTYAGTFTLTSYNGASSSEFGNSLFVKKGMKLWVTSNTNATIRFFPLM